MPKPMTQFEYQDAANDHARAQCGASGAAVETVARRPQRRFTAADKLRIVQAAEIASASGKRGAIGEVMRREGVYGSQLAAWRRQFASDPVDGLDPRKRGRKPVVREDSIDVRDLWRRNAALEKEVRVLKAALDLQKQAQNMIRMAFPELSGASEDVQ